jgi:DNA-binding response OmpR family regulator
VVRIALRSNSQRTRRSRARLEPLDFDSKAGVVWIDGKSTAIELTLLQAKLLAFLVDHSGEICSRDEIASSVYGAFTSNEAIDRLVSRLRDKLDDNPKKPRFIDSVRGVGYRLITKE